MDTTIIPKSFNQNQISKVNCYGHKSRLQIFMKFMASFLLLVTFIGHSYARKIDISLLHQKLLEGKYNLDFY